MLGCNLKHGNTFTYNFTATHLKINKRLKLYPAKIIMCQIKKNK